LYVYPSCLPAYVYAATTTTGKTTFLRALAGGEIKGLPTGCQVLHVEQEVAGDDTTVMQVRMQECIDTNEWRGRAKWCMYVQTVTAPYLSLDGTKGLHLVCVGRPMATEVL
jgi:hypothetical protein